MSHSLPSSHCISIFSDSICQAVNLLLHFHQHFRCCRNGGKVFGSRGIHTAITGIGSAYLMPVPAFKKFFQFFGHLWTLFPCPKGSILPVRLFIAIGISSKIHGTVIAEFLILVECGFLNRTSAVGETIVASIIIDCCLLSVFLAQRNGKIIFGERTVSISSCRKRVVRNKGPFN